MRSFFGGQPSMGRFRGDLARGDLVREHRVLGWPPGCRTRSGPAIVNGGHGCDVTRSSSVVGSSRHNTGRIATRTEARTPPLFRSSRKRSTGRACAQGPARQGLADAPVRSGSGPRGWPAVAAFGRYGVGEDLGVRVLGHEPHMALGAQSRAEEDASRGRAGEALGEPEQGRLAGTVVAAQNHDLAWAHSQIDAGEDVFLRGIAKSEITKGQGGFGPGVGGDCFVRRSANRGGRAYPGQASGGPSYRGGRFRSGPGDWRSGQPALSCSMTRGTKSPAGKGPQGGKTACRP